MSVATATRQVVSADFALAIASGIAGFLVSEIATSALRTHVFDVPFRGGDALYGVIVAIALVYLPVVPNEYARPAAFGAAMSGTLTTLEDFGVVGRVENLA